MAVARIVLGITGGIAAYKACELIRLLVAAGHDVAAASDPRGRALRRRRDLLRARSHGGADRSVPAPPARRPDRGRPAHGPHDGAARARARRRRAHRGRARARRPGPRRTGDEHPDVGAPGDPGEPRAAASPAASRSSGRRAVSSPRARSASAGWPSRPRSSPAPRALLRLSSSLQGKHVVVTAGGTREPIDSVRFIGNRSSGRMGIALADEARRRGARVTLLAANVAAAAPAGVEVVPTPTAADLEREALARADADVIVMAAAVADYRPATPVDGKAAEGRRPVADRAHSDDRHRPCARRRRRRPTRCSSRSAPSTGRQGSSGSGRCSRDKNVDLVVYNDVGRERHRLRQPRQRGHADHAPTATASSRVPRSP